MGSLYPLTVMYSRVLESLEQRPSQLSLHRDVNVDGGNYRQTHPEEWYRIPASPALPNSGEWVHKWYLVPFSDSGSSASSSWARKLGASATITFQNPNRVALPFSEPTQADTIAIDAGGAGYSESTNPEWEDRDPTPGALNDNQRQPSAGQTATATWTFTVPTAGWYRIEATGLAEGSNPLPAGTYSISYGSTVSENVTPTTPLTFATGQSWQPLATKYLPAGSLAVQLTTDATGTNIADGMRIVHCSLQITTVTAPTTDTAGATVEIKPAVR